MCYRVICYGEKQSKVQCIGNAREGGGQGFAVPHGVVMENLKDEAPFEPRHSDRKKARDLVAQVKSAPGQGEVAGSKKHAWHADGPAGRPMGLKQQERERWGRDGPWARPRASGWATVGSQVSTPGGLTNHREVLRRRGI